MRTYLISRGGEQIAIFIEIINKQSINPSSSFRPRHVKFLASQLEGVKSRTQNRRGAREREPSRLPLKQLSRMPVATLNIYRKMSMRTDRAS